MKSILTASAWKVFIAFLAGIILADVVASYAATYFNWNREYGPYPTLKYSLMILVLFSYPYLVGRALNQRLPATSGDVAQRRVLIVVFLAIVNNMFSVYFSEVYGLSWLVVLATVLLNIICLITVLVFPARLLKSIELKRRARLIECSRELVLFMLWPLFIWWMHPILTAIAVEHNGLKK